MFAENKFIDLLIILFYLFKLFKYNISFVKK
jgi:hypothetical protein